MTMKKKWTGHHLDGLIALLLFGVFAACLLAVLLTGAGAYRRLTQRDEQMYSRRTIVQYIATRVRQAKNPSDVELKPFGRGEALTIADRNGFVTRVYFHDGYLMELYTEEDSILNPQDGEKIMETGDLTMSMEDGMLRIIAVDREGERDEMFLSLKPRSPEKKGGVQDEE